MPQPSLRQLKYLVALSETGHFRRAAERVGVTQPSLSAQIQALEEALGLPLVERGRSPVRLTPLGREMIPRARRVLEDVQGMVDLAEAARDGLVGTIRLGAPPTLGPYLLPYIVGALHRDHPDLRLYIRESPPRMLEGELDRATHDVVLAQLPLAGADFVTERLFREPLMLALPAEHALAHQESIAPQDLRGQQILSLSPEFHLHDQISELARDFGAVLQRDYEGTSLDALRQMVGMGMGVTFLPALYVRSELTGRGREVAVRRLSGPKITRSIGMAWRRRAGRTEGYRQIARVIRAVSRAQFPELTVEGPS